MSAFICESNLSTKAKWNSQRRMRLCLKIISTLSHRSKVTQRNTVLTKQGHSSSGNLQIETDWESLNGLIETQPSWGRSSQKHLLTRNNWTPSSLNGERSCCLEDGSRCPLGYFVCVCVTWERRHRSLGLNTQAWQGNSTPGSFPEPSDRVYRDKDKVYIL